MSAYRHELGRVALVLLLAFAARAGFVIAWHATHDPQHFEFPDSESYWELGRDLATGEPYEFGSPDRRVHRGPGYPLVLASLFRTVGPDASPASARWLGAAIGTLTVGVVYWLARILFDRRVALWAAIVVALYPETIATSVLPLSDGPFCLWMVLQLVLWRYAVAATHANGTALAACAGAVGGIATLTRPSWLLYSPLLALAWWIGARIDRRILQLSVAMMFGLVAVMSPWWVRSYQITGRFVPTVLWVGPSLYDGLHPAADGSSNMEFVPNFEAQLRADDAAHPPAAGAAPFEFRFDRLMRDEALVWARENPGRVLQLAGVKLVRMWNIWPNERAFRRWWVRAAIAGTYVPLMLLAIYGGWRIRRRGFDLLLLVSPAVYFSLLHAVFIGSLRYRQPALLTLAILAAVAIESLVARFTTPTTADRAS